MNVIFSSRDENTLKLVCSRMGPVDDVMLRKTFHVFSPPKPGRCAATPETRKKYEDKELHGKCVEGNVMMLKRGVYAFLGLQLSTLVPLS